MAQANPTALESIPSIEEILGANEEAMLDVSRLREMAQSLAFLKRVQEDEGLRDDDVVPGSNPTERTFAQQRERIRKAYERRWESIEQAGNRAIVKQKLAELKQ